MEERRKEIARRARQVTRTMPSLLLVPDLDGLLDKASSRAWAVALNEAFARGWAQAEADFAASYGLLEVLADEEQFEELAKFTAPRSRQGYLFRTDWIIHERARALMARSGASASERTPPTKSNSLTKNTKEATNKVG